MNRRFNIFLIASLLLLSSCNDKGIVPDTPDGSSAIQFGKVTTKAVDSIEDIDEFGVSIAVTTADPSAGYGSVMENEMVYRDGEGGWTYNNTRYWIDDYYYYFLASYPYYDSNGDPWGFEAEIPEDGGMNLVIYNLNVTIPESADLDILTATEFVNTNDQWTMQDVSMDFSHLLTKVNFKIQQDFDKDPDFDYYVTKVTLTGVKSSGTYMFLPFGTTAPYHFSRWNFEGATTFSIEKNFSDPVILRDKDAIRPEDKKVTLTVWEDDVPMLIPQPIAANSVIVRVDYIYDITPDDGDPGYTEHFVETAIPASDDLWQSGKVIVYNLKISEENDITFSPPTVRSWGSAQTGGTIIIK